MPVLFVSSTSFVLALCLALASWLLAAAVFADHGTDGGRRAVAALGALGGVATVGLATVPFFFQH